MAEISLKPEGRSIFRGVERKHLFRPSMGSKTVGRARPTSGISFLMVWYKTEKISGSSYNDAANGVCMKQD